jgi:hypothetical protein
MEKLDENLLKRVEAALKLTLHDWQKNYILEIPMVLNMRITGRGTGKTLAYVLKILLTEGRPIRLYDMLSVYALSDDYHNKSGTFTGYDNHYTQWFRNCLLEVHQCLISAGIQTRRIFYSQREEFDYYKQQFSSNLVPLETVKGILNEKYGTEEIKK